MTVLVWLLAAVRITQMWRRPRTSPYENAVLANSPLGYFRFEEIQHIYVEPRT